MRAGWLATGIGLLVFACYSANGREVGSYDTQPAKYTVYQLVAHRTFNLDSIVARQPALGERMGFALARDGHIRSAHSVAPAVLAWVPAGLLKTTGLVPLRLSNSAVFAKLAASLLVTLAVVFVFFAARWRAGDAWAALVAVGFGLGTNAWPTASQSLWGHESVLFGLALATMCLAPTAVFLRPWRLWMAAVGLAIAGASRYQVALPVLVLSAGLLARAKQARDAAALLPIAVAASTAIGLNLLWFGRPLGAMAQFETVVHPEIHAVSGPFSAAPWAGAIGLLLSPSRGLLVFSPVVLVALAGVAAAWREGWRSDVRWCALAAVLQFCTYACYSVWWGGHTYGPRYLIDLLPLLVPLAAAGTLRLRTRRAAKALAGAALAWSVTLAATGAFCYPADAWNTSPASVDLNHGRLWDWHDPQFVRCWSRGLSPQNFSLWRPAPPAR